MHNDKDIELAIQYLAERYYKQLEEFPLMRKDISLDQYITANLPYVLRNDRRMIALREGKGIDFNIWG